MQAIEISLFASIAVLAVGGHHMIMQRRHRRQIEAYKAKFRTLKSEATKRLDAAHQESVALKHQLAAARLEAKRADRLTPPAPKSQLQGAEESLLLMLDDSHRNYGPAGGFADTTIRFHGSNDSYTRYRQ